MVKSKESTDLLFLMIVAPLVTDMDISKNVFLIS